jgi:hypothetical protein
VRSVGAVMRSCRSIDGKRFVCLCKQVLTANPAQFVSFVHALQLLPLCIGGAVLPIHDTSQLQKFSDRCTAVRAPQPKGAACSGMASHTQCWEHRRRYR